MQRRFVRSNTMRFLRLGKNRRKRLKWRRARGKSNKMRIGRAGHPSVPKVGFRTPIKEAGKVDGLVPKLVHNVKEIESMGKNEIAILARVGARNKLEMIKKADALKIKIMNLGGKK